MNLLSFVHMNIYESNTSPRGALQMFGLNSAGSAITLRLCLQGAQGTMVHLVHLCESKFCSVHMFHDVLFVVEYTHTIKGPSPITYSLTF